MEISKILLKISVFIVGFAAIERLCHLATDGFSLQRIRPFFSIDEKYTPSMPSKAICQDLNQPFRYLASGSQSFAFISQDGRYVLKFFKLRPTLFSLHKGARRRHSFQRAFDSCLLYQKHLEVESGMLYCHLSPCKGPLPTIQLSGPAGVCYSQDLNAVPFVLQRRAETIEKRLLRLQALKNTWQQKQTIDRLLRLMVKRYQLGFSDKDPNWLDNFGFVDDHVVSLDVGGLIADRPNLKSYFLNRELPKAEMKAIHWLKRFNPDLIPYVEKKVAEIKSEIH